MSKNNIELVDGIRRSFGGVRSLSMAFKGVYVLNHIEQHTLMLLALAQSVKRHSQITVVQKYYKTADAANYFGVDPTFLTKRQGNVFEEGVHFFRPSESKIIRWSLEALEEWMKAPTKEEENDADILDKMFE